MTVVSTPVPSRHVVGGHSDVAHLTHFPFAQHSFAVLFCPSLPVGACLPTRHCVREFETEGVVRCAQALKSWAPSRALFDAHRPVLCRGVFHFACFCAVVIALEQRVGPAADGVLEQAAAGSWGGQRAVPGAAAEQALGHHKGAPGFGEPGLGAGGCS